MDRTFVSILTGTDCWGANPVKEAIAKRAAEIISGFTPKSDKDHPAGLGYCYDGNRCKPESLGWRFEQMFGSPEPQEILDGKWDAEIEETYHEAADSEYWYRYEKDWGEF